MSRSLKIVVAIRSQLGPGICARKFEEISHAYENTATKFPDRVLK